MDIRHSQGCSHFLNPDIFHQYFNVLVARLFLQGNSQIFWIVNISYAKFLRNLFIYLTFESFNRKTFESTPPVTCISRQCTVLKSFVWNDLRKDEFYTLKLWYIRNDATFSESLCKVCMYIKSENKHLCFCKKRSFLPSFTFWWMQSCIENYSKRQ